MSRAKPIWRWCAALMRTALIRVDRRERGARHARRARRLHRRGSCRRGLSGQSAGRLGQDRRRRADAWPEWHPVPVDKVHHVGEPVAFVVAESAAIARDAADAVIVDIAGLPAACDAEGGDRARTPRRSTTNIPGNISVNFRNGDREKVAEAFAAAAHVTRLKIVNSRVVVNAMEPRSALGILRCGERPLHPAHLHAGRLCHAQPDRPCAERCARVRSAC